MTPQERDLLTTLLSRLKGAAGQPKDPDADGLIRQTMTEQPDAPYYLAQTVLIQDLSLHNAQNRIAELERQVSEAQQQAARPTSFLGGLFGSHSAPPAQPPAPPPSSGSVPAAGPWTRAPQVAAAPPAQPYGQPYPPQGGGYGPAPGAGYGPASGGFMGGGGAGAGGGFLRSAAATAAGVAGGALLFQGIESLFGRHESAGILGSQAMTPGLGETVVNNYYGDAGQAGGNQDFSGGSFDPSGNQDFSGGSFDPNSGQDFSGGSFDPNSGQDFSGGSFDPSGGGQDFSSDQDFGGGDFGGDSNQC
ncbi:MAG TPA: DUF2076 domain-containing protein [Stellaceae bacterium]|nr:DUF2076 domain-containing protein [Stellaceae bacterium]